MLKFLSKHRLSHLQLIALGYFIIIMLGASLLLLPIATKSGQSSTPMEAVFTATSATCVTGQVIVDTYIHWSLFGQIVILSLIQIGGLGFMTIATMFSMVLRRRIGLRERQVMVQSINTSHIGGILKLTKRIIVGTIVFELIGAILLSIRFIPQFGTAKGIYFSIFHSISAFCNAGFDLMGEYGQFGSLIPYRGDVLVNLIIIGLVIIGGIGFLVWDDIYIHKLNFKRYQLHTKIVLATSAILILGGAVLIYFFEKGQPVIGDNVYEKILTALFSSISSRTAGYSVIDIGLLQNPSKFIIILLMFIGGSPGSTAGGVKTTSIAVAVICAISRIKHQQNPSIFERKIKDDTLKDANAIIALNLMLIIIGTLVICGVQELGLIDVFVETTSVMSTVGFSTGITTRLETFPKIILIVMMYFGRVGSVSFAVALLEKKARPPVELPSENIIIG